MKIFGKLTFPRSLLIILPVAFIAVATVFVLQNTTAQSALKEVSMLAHYRELFELSQNENKGLTFYVNGQTIPGLVTKIIGDEAIEVRNQTHDRLIIRLKRIDAVALN